MIGVGAPPILDALAEVPCDVGAGRRAALVLDRIVEERCDRLVLVGPVLDRDRGGRQQMSDVGRVASLPLLVAVEGQGGGLARGGHKGRDYTAGQVDSAPSTRRSLLGTDRYGRDPISR